MKILVVSTVPGTIWAFLKPFGEYFVARGWKVDALSKEISSYRDCSASFTKVWDVDWSRLPLAFKNIFHAPEVVRKIVTAEKYDIVHVHTPVAAFVCRYALRNLRKKLGTKIIYTAHGFHFYEGGPPLKNFVFRLLERVAGAWTDFLIVINKDDELAARKFNILPPERIVYMPGIGVDTKHYSRSREGTHVEADICAELNLDPQAPRFLVIAEFIPRKRHKDILKAFARLQERHAYLLLAGNGPLMSEMREMTHKLGIAERVYFLGFRLDIPKLICASTAVVLPSEQEGLPRAIMEALCLETPCIGSNIRGTRELLDDGCGLLVEVGDVDGYTSAMETILDNPEKTRFMVQQGHSQMRDYDIRRIIALHENVYEEALNVDYC